MGEEESENSRDPSMPLSAFLYEEESINLAFSGVFQDGDIIFKLCSCYFKSNNLDKKELKCKRNRKIKETNNVKEFKNKSYIIFIDAKLYKSERKNKKITLVKNPVKHQTILKSLIHYLERNEIIHKLDEKTKKYIINEIYVNLTLVMKHFFEQNYEELYNLLIKLIHILDKIKFKKESKYKLYNLFKLNENDVPFNRLVMLMKVIMILSAYNMCIIYNLKENNILNIDIDKSIHEVGIYLFTEVKYKDKYNYNLTNFDINNFITINTHKIFWPLCFLNINNDRKSIINLLKSFRSYKDLLRKYVCWCRPPLFSVDTEIINYNKDLIIYHIKCSDKNACSALI